MSSQRLLLLAVALLASVSIALSGSPKRNDVNVGSLGPYDHLVHAERLTIKSKWLRVVKETKTFSTDNGRNITMLKLHDQKGNGATASVIGGGPGHTYVTVKFQSVRGHGIDFMVELFGR